MTNKSLVFAGIFAAILGNNAFATGENIVTSKSYVDNALEQKQNKIEAYDENNDEYQSVLTDTKTDGVVGKKRILTADLNDGDPLDAWGEDDSRIPTVGAVYQMAQSKISARATKINGDDQSFAPSVVTNGTSDGDVGQMAIVTHERMSSDGLFWDDYNYDNLIPTLGVVGQVAENVANDVANNIDIPDISNLQTKIAASEWEDGSNNTIPGVVISTDTDGDVDQRMILDKTNDITNEAIANTVARGYDNGDDYSIAFDIHSNSVGANDVNNAVPTTTMTIAIANAAANAAAATKQNKIAGYNPNNDEEKSLLTDTTTDGVIGKIDIMDSDGNAGDVIQDWAQEDDIIPTAGAIANAIQALPWNTREQNATATYSTTFADSGSNVWPTWDSYKFVEGETFANAMAVKQNRMTCAGWPDSVPVADRTDANCWLWNKN